MLEQAKQAARASRGDGWRLDEKLSEGEIDLPNNLPIRMWIFTMKHIHMGHQGEVFPFIHSLPVSTHPGFPQSANFTKET